VATNRNFIEGDGALLRPAQLQPLEHKKERDEPYSALDLAAQIQRPAPNY
jgi:hypothetical protein